MQELMQRQTLLVLANNHSAVAALVEEAFRKLGEAKRLMKAALGQSHDRLFHDRISDYWLEEPDKPTSAMRESLTTIQENFWSYLLLAHQKFMSKIDLSLHYLARLVQRNLFQQCEIFDLVDTR